MSSPCVETTGVFSLRLFFFSSFLLYSEMECVSIIHTSYAKVHVRRCSIVCVCVYVGMKRYFVAPYLHFGSRCERPRVCARKNDPIAYDEK